MHWQCVTYNALPGAGGILDQDAGLMAKMRTVNTVYELVKDYKRACDRHKGAQWQRENKTGFELITALRNEGVL